MPVKIVYGRITQSSADAAMQEVVKIPVNSLSKFNVPLLRILYIEATIDPVTTAAWASTALSFSFSLEKYPITQKPIKFNWSFAVRPGALIECQREWRRAEPFPLIASDELQVKLDTGATAQINYVDWLLYYEEVENPSELELTLGFIT